MNQEMKNNLLNAMSMMIENNGEFTTYQQLSILEDLVNAMSVVTDEAKLPFKPIDYKLGL
jgi:division protein CdvB (Snf7/Vps24/ESCRT-III family)